MKNISRTIPLLLLICLFFTSPIFADSTAVLKKELEQPNEALLWIKYSNEYIFSTKQAYTNALPRLKKLVENEKPGSWAVVFDMDETLVSNVGYQYYLCDTGQEFNNESWDNWCNQEACPPLAGAVDFTNQVKKLGGKVIVITNRSGNLLEASKGNLKKIGIPFDAVVLKTGPYADDDTKEMRRNNLEKGELKTLTASEKLPPLKIIMLAGDQQHDLFDPDMMEASQALKHFGDKFIIIPNPMYGNWLTKAMKNLEKSPVSTIILNKGQSFKIQLESAGSTGYQWDLEGQLNPALIKLVDKEIIPPDSEKLGAPGKEAWVFEALGEGNTTITMVYRRPWEKDKPAAKKKIINVIINP